MLPQIVRVSFLCAYSAFVIFSLLRLVLSARQSQGKSRRRIGAAGLIVGTYSATLLLLFYLHFWVFGTLIAHGSVLWIYMFLGCSLAITGTALGLAGLGWVRRSSVMISLVMVCQWLRSSAAGAGSRNTLDLAMIAILIAFGILTLGTKLGGDLHPES